MVSTYRPNGSLIFGSSPRPGRDAGATTSQYAVRARIPSRVRSGIRSLQRRLQRERRLGRRWAPGSCFSWAGRASSMTRSALSG